MSIADKVYLSDGFVLKNVAAAYIFMKVRQEGDVPPYPTTPNSQKATLCAAMRLGYRPEYRDAMFA